MKKYGFTLAEVLIALGIIGVVSALTISTLVKNYNKKVIDNGLKVGYSTYTNGVKLSEVENGPSKDWDVTLNGNDFWNRYYANYFKGAKLCSNLVKCGYKNVDTSVWTGLQLSAATSNDRILFMLPNNIVIFYIYRKNTQVRHFFIDANGLHGPNKKNKDVFEFTIDANNQLRSTILLDK